MLKTHFVIALFSIILFFPLVNNKIIFIMMVVIATIIPDLDTRFSKFGRKNPLTFILGFFTKHRGVMHSLTFAIILSVLLALWLPIASFGFFLGYSVHLLCDSMTKKGIRPFWPSKKTFSGFLQTGGKIETGVFVTFVVLDFLLVIFYLIK